MSIVLKSIWGRDVGLDRNDYLTARVGIKTPALFLGPSETEVDSLAVTTATTATAYVLPQAGTVLLASTAGSSNTFALPAPLKGVPLLIFVTGVSTSQKVSSTAAGVTIQSTVSSSNALLTFGSSLAGQAITLAGLSTSLWGIIDNVGSVTVSTV